jgi:hypothetical protein
MSKTSGTNAITSQKVGPTFSENDPAKFTNKGKMSGKTMSNGVVDHGKGATWTENSTHIPTMNADKPPMESKVKKTSKWFDPHSASKPMNASEGHTTPAKNGLKSSYEK